MKNANKTFTFAFMDPPFENERTVSFFRLLSKSLEMGFNVRVFAYEGAVALSFAKQSPHGNAIHGKNTEEEAHPLTKNWIQSLQQVAAKKNLEFLWVNCGLCVDERGVNEAIDGCIRGGPPDLWRHALESDNSLIIGTR